MRISIEGNIGSGKSSVLAALRLPDTATTHEEPLREWGDLLDLYYADPTTWSLAFNLKVLHGFHAHADVVTDELRVVERSPDACRYVFGQLAYNDGHFASEAWDVFKKYHAVLGWEPDAYICIDVPPEICFERMRRRGRSCESKISLEYLQRIDFQYQNFLKFTKVPVYHIDGTRELRDIVEDIERVIRSVTHIQ